MSSSRAIALLIVLLPATHVFLTSTVPPSAYGFAGEAVYDAKRLLQLLVLPAMLALGLLHAPLRSALAARIAQVPKWLGAALLAWFALGLASAFVNAQTPTRLTHSLAYSLADVGLLASVVAAVFCIAASRDVSTVAFDRVLAGFLVLVPLAVGFQEVLGVFAVRASGLEFGFYISLPNFHFPRFYNQMQSWMIPATVAVVLVFPGRRLAGVLAVAALALHWHVVLATGARGTMVGVGLALIGGIALLPRVRWLLLRYQAAGIAGGLALFLALAATAPSAAPAESPEAASATGNVTQSPSFHGDSLTGALGGERMRTSSGRTAMWRDSLRDAREHPALGIGPGNYACGGWRTRGAHPHSFPIQILGEWGVPAFLLLAGIAAFLAIGALQRARSKTLPDGSARLAGVLLCAVTAAAIHACLSGVYLMPASQLTGVLIGGWLLSSLLPAGARAPGERPKRRGVYIIVATLIAALALAGWGWRDYSVRERQYGHLPAWDLAFPRFWHNGKVCADFGNSQAGED